MKRWFMAIWLAAIMLPAASQDLSNIRGTTPFRITGSFGTHNTFYSGSSSFSYRNPWSNNVFANLNLSVYGMEIPLSFYFSNNNRGFNHPFAQFGMSPRYKALQLHLGYRNMNFSPYTFSNITFLGAGLDFNWKVVRLAFFGGSLNQPNMSQVSTGLDPVRPTLFKRNAYGVKLGIGNTRNYFDVIFFNARDDSTSINAMQYPHLKPRENLIAGTSFRFSLGRRLVISSNVGASAYNENMRSTSLDVAEMQGLDKYFTARYGTVLRYAGDIRANLSFNKVQTMFQYRLIQPDYYSLGTTYMTNNLQSMSVNVNSMMLKNRLIAGLAFHYQTDNVSKTQLFTSTGMIYNANLTARLSDKLNVTATYNGFNQQQRDGTAQVIDSLRIHRLMHNINLSPSYNFLKGNLLHGISASLNTSINSNQNKLISDPSEITVIAANMSYSLGLNQQKMNLMLNLNHQSSSSAFYDFTSSGLGMGVGKKLLAQDQLNLQLNGDVKLSQVNELTRNLSFMAGVNVGYTYQKNHTAFIRLNYNQINNYHLQGLYSLNGSDMTVAFGYNYRFSPQRQRKEKTDQQAMNTEN
jgi:hypothetical protein